MNTIIKAIFTVILMTALSACGGGGGGPTEPTDTGITDTGLTDTGLTADFTPASTSSSSGTVTLQKSSTSGDTVYLDILATGVTGVFGADIKIDYDATKVSWGGSHQVGGQFAGGNSYSSLDGGVEGRVVIGVTGTSEASGDIVIVTVPFKVIGRGGSSITISTDSQLTDSTAPVPAEISISSWHGGDVEGI